MVLYKKHMSCWKYVCCYENRVENDLEWTRNYVTQSYLKQYPGPLLSHSSRNPRALYSFTLNNRRYWVQKANGKPQEEVVDEYGLTHFTSIHISGETVELTVRLPVDIQCSAHLLFTMQGHEMELIVFQGMFINGI